MTRFSGAQAGEIEFVVDEYLEPAVDGLRGAVLSRDVHAIRAYAYEIVAVAGTIVGACAEGAGARRDGADHAPGSRQSVHA
jgi:hypothetical protein